MNGGKKSVAPHVQAAISAVQMKASSPVSPAARPLAAAARPLAAAAPRTPAILPKLAAPPLRTGPPPRALPVRIPLPPPPGRKAVQRYRSSEMEEIGAEIGQSLRPLFGVEDDPTTPIEDLAHGLPWWTRLRLGNKGVVDELFRRFNGYGFRYHVGMSSQTNLLGLPGSFYQRTDLQNGHLQGNCIAYAHGFRVLLERFGIAAEVREVRTEEQGAFVTKVTQNFIDPRVTGNIRYKNGNVIPGRYLFSNHAATWVPSVRLYYDPMIRSSYASFSGYIDRSWRLTSIGGSKDAYWLAQPQYGGNAVVLSDQWAPGFPGSTWQLVKRKGRYRSY